MGIKVHVKTLRVRNIGTQVIQSNNKQQIQIYEIKVISKKKALG